MRAAADAEGVAGLLHVRPCLAVDRGRFLLLIAGVLFSNAGFPGRKHACKRPVSASAKQGREVGGANRTSMHVLVVGGDLTASSFGTIGASVLY